MKVICIDASNRPNEIPSNRWIEKDSIYTILEVKKMNIQGGLLGCKLAEINNDDLYPWCFFNMNRFRPLSDDLELKEEEEEELEVC